MSWRKSGKCCPDPCVTNPCTATTCPQVSSALITGNVWQVPACDGTAGVLFPCMTSALIGAYIYNPLYGYFLITAFNSSTNVVTVQNTCIEGNAAAGTSVPSGSSFIFTSIVSSSSGGACVNEVTEAEFNALVAASDLEPGCLYTITDHSQNRVPAGTRVTVTALSTTQVTSACSVLTSYDDKVWRGTYDQDTNLLMELWDNQGNYASNYGNPDLTSLYTCVDDFDWGN